MRLPLQCTIVPHIDLAELLAEAYQMRGVESQVVQQVGEDLANGVAPGYDDEDKVTEDVVPILLDAPMLNSIANDVANDVGALLLAVCLL